MVVVVGQFRDLPTLVPKNMMLALEKHEGQDIAVWAGLDSLGGLGGRSASDQKAMQVKEADNDRDLGMTYPGDASFQALGYR